jgi:hypothetical protein
LFYGGSNWDWHTGIKTQGVIRMSINPILLLEQLSADTWDRIRYSEELNISFGEESITDLNLLEIKKSRTNSIHVIKFTKQQEALVGIDWEWWIGSRQKGWLRYAVQAKKINSKSRRYDSIGHKIDGLLQLNILEEFAYKVSGSAIPIYCFYNYINNPSPKPNLHWHCNSQYDERQLGCTVTPSFIVRIAIETRGYRNFDFIHLQPYTIPWRCLLKCQARIPGSSRRHPNFGFNNVRTYPQLPSYLDTAIYEDYKLQSLEDYPVLSLREIGEMDFQSRRIYGNRGEVRVIPKMILVIDISEDIKVKEN